MQLIQLFCFLYLLVTPAWAGKASEEFEKYLKKMVPLSFQIAEQDATLRESTLLFQRVFEMQENLALSTDTSIGVEKLSTEVFLSRASDADISGSDEEMIDPFLKTLFYITQLKNTLSNIRAKRDRFYEIHNSYSSACESGFETYKVGYLNINFQDVKVESMDGFFIDGSSLISFFATLGESIFQIFDNSSEKEKIENLKAEYRKKLVQDDDYRKFAREACLKNKKNYLSLVQSYRDVMQSLDVILLNIDASKVDLVHRKVLGFLVKYPEQSLKRAKSGVAALVREELDPGYKKDQKNILATSIYLKLGKFIRALSSSPCGEGGEMIDGIKALIGTAKLYQLNDSEVLDASAAMLKDRAEKCKSSYL